MEKQHLKLMYTFMFIEGEGDFGLSCNHSLSAGYPTEAHTRAGQIQELPDYTEAVAWLDDVSSCIFLVI
jgi:hypothetical protein